MKKLLSIVLTLVIAITLINLNNSFVKAEDTPTPLTFTAVEANSTVKFNWLSGSDVKYKTTGTTSPAASDWTTYGANTTITLTNIGDTVSFKGTNVKTSATDSKHFSMTGKIAASGDVTSLTNGIGGVTTLTENQCYHAMFNGCKALTSIDDLKLPSTTITESCYYSMFYQCEGLTSLPEGLLPALSLQKLCYNNMFAGCKGLTSIPEKLLKATTLVDGCYANMFKGCTGLTSIPEKLLPATTLAKECYTYMFSGCDKITNIPNLPATTLKEKCYQSMFSGCTSLTSLPIGLLPATDLADYCYYYMFYGCNQITNIPNLPATTFVNGCYCSMFEGCTDLYKGLSESQTQELTEQFTIPTSDQTITWVAGCTNDMFKNTGGGLTQNPDFSTAKTYYRKPAPKPISPDQGDMPYDDTNGFYATITKGSATPITAHIENVKKDTDTVAVKNGDDDLKDTDYTIEAGSTNANSIKVIFQPIYLNGLDIGDTTLKIIINGTKEFKVTITSKNPTPSPTPSPSDPSKKDESCEKVIGPTWHWNNSKGICEDYGVVGTYTR